MKTLLALAFLLVLAGCGQGNQIDPALQPYVDSFVQAGNIAITTPMIIQFGNLGGNAENGQCTLPTLGPFTILIDSTAWANDSEVDRQMLVWHELGHCVLGRTHNTSGGPSDPVSIMYPTAEDASAGYTANPAPFIQELFHP
jgi:hypothetical protein